MGGQGEIEPTAWVHAAFTSLWDHLVPEDRLTRSDALLCFGSRFPRVPDRAASLYHLGVAPYIVATGAPSKPGEASEADRFAEALIAQGVPEKALILERQARHTGENATLAISALRAHLEPTTVTLVTWPLAARRARATMAAHHPSITSVSAPALRRPGWRWRPTRRRIHLALGELTRIETYSREGLIEPVPTPDQVSEAARMLRAELGRHRPNSATETESLNGSPGRRHGASACSSPVADLR